MTIYYKSVRYIDGKMRWVITDEDDNIVNKRPTRDELKDIIDDPRRNKSAPTRNLENRRCYKCGGNKTYIDSSGNYYWLVTCNEDTDWKERYTCTACYHEYHRKLPDSYVNIIKSMADCRIGNIDIDSTQGMFIISQAVIAKIHKVEDLNIKEDNFGLYIDMEDNENGKIDVKSSKLNIQKYTDLTGNVCIYYKWTFNNNRKIDCNIYICVGFSEDLRYIECVWIIPNEEWICSLSEIGIYKTSRPSKYDQFRVLDIEPYNSAYHSLISFLGDKKYFGIDDIKKWSNNYVKN